MALAVPPIAWGATRSAFWTSEHSEVPVATLIYLAIVGAMVLWRARWAWVVLVLLQAAVLISWVINASAVRLVYAPVYVAGVACFALLFSPELRVWVRSPRNVREHRTSLH